MFKNASVVGYNADPREYHKEVAKRGEPGFVMSSSRLRDFYRCPDKWRRGADELPTDAMAFGNLVDCLLLTPSLFKHRYALRPETYRNEDGENKPWNGNAKVCRQWMVDAKKENVEVVTTNDLNEAKAIVDRLKADEEIMRMLAVADFQVWVKAEWHDPATKIVVPVQSLLDIVPKKTSEFLNSFADLKSTNDAAVRAWLKQCWKDGCYVQAALHGDLFNLATGEQRQKWCYVLVETTAPYQIGRRMLSGHVWRDRREQPEDRDFVMLGRTAYKRMLATYCKCLATGHWPDYDDNAEARQGWTIMYPEAYMETAWMNELGFTFRDGKEAPKEDEENLELVP